MATLPAALDVAVVTTALPYIAKDFRASQTAYSWVGSAYLLTHAAITPFWANCSDIFGRKPILLLANIIFLVGSLVCALANSFAMLIAGRGIQGAGAGSLIILVNIGSFFPARSGVITLSGIEVLHFADRTDIVVGSTTEATRRCSIWFTALRPECLGLIHHMASGVSWKGEVPAKCTHARYEPHSNRKLSTFLALSRATQNVDQMTSLMTACRGPRSHIRSSRMRHRYGQPLLCPNWKKGLSLRVARGHASREAMTCALDRHPFNPSEVALMLQSMGPPEQSECQLLPRSDHFRNDACDQIRSFNTPQRKQ